MTNDVPQAAKPCGFAPDGLPGRIVEIGLMAALLSAPTQYGIEILPKTYLSLVDPIIWLTFLFWLAGVVRARAWEALRVSPFAVLFILAAAVSAIHSSARLSAAKDVFQFVEYFVVAHMVFCASLADRMRRNRLVTVFVVAGSVVVSLALAQYFNGAVDPFKVAGTFGNRNVLGGYLALLLPVAGGALLFKNSPGRAIWYGVLLAAGLAVTLSGGAFMAIVAALGLMCAARGRRAFLVFAVTTIALLTVALPRLPRANTEVLGQSIAVFNEDGGFTTRYPEWQAGLAMARANPITGVGVGNYQRSIGGYYGTVPDPTVASEPDSQNLYLVLSSTIGLPGLLCFMGMLMLPMLRGGGAVRLCQRRPESQALAIAAAGALASFALCCVWSPLLVRGIGIPLAFVLALAEAGGRETGAE